jgi:hypothetical protein
MLKSIYFICLFLFGINSFSQVNAVEKKLFEMPDVIFTKIATPEGFESAYELMIKQPLDHNNVDAGSFYQRVFYSYRHVDAPTIMVTEGYERSVNRIYELTNLLKGNQIQVEHRFFGKSVPDTIEYQYLTLENATADLHKINQLFRCIHDNDFISTGISKGGQTTIFYRYFYPNDVDVSVPYVAPLNTSIEDKRIYNFLNEVGTKECRDKIKKFQIKLLRDRDKYLDKIKWFTKGAENKFTYLTFDQAYEYAVLEYSFSFWQWGSNCEDIPDDSAKDDEIIDHFLAVSGLSFFADESMKQYASHYYQAGTQMGYYGYDISDFKKYITALPNDKNPSAVFMPNKLPILFDSSLTSKVAEWIDTMGNEFIYIYGANDTWSATGIKPNKQRNSKWYYMEGKDHGQARIKNLAEEERKELLSQIEEWLQAKP